MFNLIAIPALIIAPAAFLLYYFWIRDRWEKEPWSVIWVLFGLGCFSVIPAAIIELVIMGFDDTIRSVGHAFWVSFLGVALVEEGVKLFTVYVFTHRSKHFREEYDGIIYAVAVGIGFAFLENILYVGMALIEGSGFGTAIARAFTAVPAHALDGVVLGYFVGRSQFMKNPMDRFKTNMLGLLVAVLFHGLYDFFIFVLQAIPESLAGWCIVGIFWTLLVQWGTAHRMIRLAQEEDARRWNSGEIEPRIPFRVHAGPEPIAATDRKFCRQCGAKIAPNATYCPNCGQFLGSM